MKIKDKEREKVLKFMEKISKTPGENSQLTWEKYFEDLVHGRKDKKDSEGYQKIRKARSRPIES